MFEPLHSLWFTLTKKSIVDVIKDSKSSSNHFWQFHTEKEFTGTWGSGEQ